MRLLPSTLISPLIPWALALLILLLTACGPAHTVRPSGRTKPEAAMKKPDRPAPPPTNMSQLTKDQQAALSAKLYLDMTDYAGQLEKKFDQLVNWINGEP